MFTFLKHFVIYGFSGILGKLATVFLIPLYTSILTKEEYGAIALITSCKGIIDLISNLNIHSGIFRDFYEENTNKKKLVSTGFYSILSISLFIFILLYLTRTFWMQQILNLSSIYEIAFIFMLMSIPSGSLTSYLLILTRFQKKSVLYTIVSILQLLIQIGITIFLLVGLKKGVSSVFIGILVAEVFSIIVLFLINRNYFTFSFNFLYLRNALVFSLPTLPAILGGWVDSSLGQVLIAKYVSLSDLGVYSLALSLSSIFLLISHALGLVWTPYIYENYKKSSFNKEVNKIYTLMYYILFFVIVNAGLLSKDIINLLSNETYSDASFYFLLLSFPMLLQVLMPMVQTGVFITKETKYFSYYSVFSSILNVVLLLCLIESFGIISVPISLAVSKLVNFILLNNYCKTRIKLVLSTRNILFLLVLVLSVISFNCIHSNRLFVYILILIFNIVFFVYLKKRFDLIHFIFDKIHNV